MRKRAIMALALTVCMLCSCGGQTTTDYSSWLPDSSVNDSSEKQNPGITDSSAADSYYKAELMVDTLFSNDSELLADYLWQDQITNGVYEVTEEELKKNTLVYYVSSSEGDDSNFGLNPNSPKKTLNQFSGASSITVLLKCGDTFEVDGSFSIGNECIYATYGQGARPVVSFYKNLDVTFTRVTEYDNVWVASLLDIDGIYNTTGNKDNCNIGQLVLNDEVNWKRIVVSSNEAEEYDYPAALAERADGSWAVDWLSSSLYLYSTVNPNEYEIKAAPDGHGIVFNAVKDATLKGWEITGVGAHGCNITKGTDITVANCFFYNIGGSVHLSAGIRYGNAIQVWNGGSDITIAYNYADWVFDSCYTDQGSDSSATSENVVFAYNIGSHAFTGIESWADSYSDYISNNVIYEHNIIYDICDITIPEKRMFASSNGSLITAEDDDTEYISYRGGYQYNKMSCVNIACAKTADSLILSSNIFWKTGRLLLLCGNITEGYVNMTGNTFYSVINAEGACLYRYVDETGAIAYTNELFIENNTEMVKLSSKDYYTVNEKKAMVSVMETVIGEQK